MFLFKNRPAGGTPQLKRSQKDRKLIGAGEGRWATSEIVRCSECRHLSFVVSTKVLASGTL